MQHPRGDVPGPTTKKLPNEPLVRGGDQPPPGEAAAENTAVPPAPLGFDEAPEEPANPPPATKRP